MRIDVFTIFPSMVDDFASQSLLGKGRERGVLDIRVHDLRSGANDPHLDLATPAPFHVVHVTVPGVVNAMGAAVPGLPGIVSGRNETCAWGITALSGDCPRRYSG